MSGTHAAALFLLASTALCAQSSTPVSSELCTDAAAISRFGSALDRRVKTLRARLFAADFGEPDQVSWREAGRKEPGLTAHVFVEKDKPVVVVLALSSESGDWVLEAAYYYRSNGTLARKRETLNTFYGHASVIRDTLFGCSGQAISKTVRHLDLKTKQVKRPDPEFIDEVSPEYKQVSRLPFFRLLNRASRR